ncbi:MAG: hypothetical protein RLZZ206_933 [Cyanobacteriota bacterium]
MVTLRPQTIDKYGRTVAEVFRNSQSVNLAMVSSGHAFAYRKYLAACDGSAYLGAEAAAQRQRVGVWAVPGGIQRPWYWRKGTRPPAASTGAPFPPAAGSAPPAAAPAGGYSGRKLTCRQIGSYARAQELLREGHTYLDRNGDGIACKSLRNWLSRPGDQAGSTKRAGPLHAPPRARAQRELAGWPALAFRGGDGGVPSRRPLASSVHVFKLPRL